MYLDLIIIVVLLIIVVCVFRKFSSFVYAFAIIDIFLRIMNFFENNIPVPELQALISKYLPDSIPTIIRTYTTDVFELILIWAYVIIFCIFWFYNVKYFIKKKK